MLPPPDNSACYARSQLCGRELQLYDDIVATLQMGQTSLNAKRINANRALEITMLVLRDHPEFYWIAGEASLGGLNGRLKMTKHLAPDTEFDSLVMAEFERLTSVLPPSCSDYTKAKQLYRAVTSYANYDNGKDISERHLIVSHSLRGVFEEHLAVCDGFSSALQYLLQHMGIQAYRLTGTASSLHESGPHAWVLAKIDGHYCHIDPTWGAIPIGGTDAEAKDTNVNYDYLCLTDDDIRASHSVNEVIAIPACTSKHLNYYAQEGLVLPLWNENLLVDIFARQIANGTNWLSLRAATVGVLERLIDTCKTSDLLHSLLAQAIRKAGRENCTLGGYAYSINEQLKCVHLLMQAT